MGSCGNDDAVGDQRAEQVRDAAREAGLPGDVVDVIVQAAQGTTATFQITYEGTGGASVVVSQAPPNRRVDIVAGEAVVESRVFRGGIGYRCLPPSSEPTAPLECQRSEGDLQAPGAFTDEALDLFSRDLARSMDDLDLSVERRELAGVTATCLVAVPKAGPTDGTGPGAETLCLSAEGGPLLVDTAGERVVARAYTTEVPAGTFDV